MQISNVCSRSTTTILVACHTFHHTIHGKWEGNGKNEMQSMIYEKKKRILFPSSALSLYRPISHFEAKIRRNTVDKNVNLCLCGAHLPTHGHHHHHHIIRLFRSWQTQLIQNTSIKRKKYNNGERLDLIQITSTNLCITFLLESHHF